MEKTTLKTADYMVNRSRKNNFYFDYNGVNVMVPALVAEAWEDLESVIIDEKHYTKITDNDEKSPTFGQLIDQDWARVQVVGVNDPLKTIKKTIRFEEAEHQLLVGRIDRKSQHFQSALQYEKAKKEALNANDLGADVVKELSALLKN